MTLHRYENDIVKQFPLKIYLDLNILSLNNRAIYSGIVHVIARLLKEGTLRKVYIFV